MLRPYAIPALLRLVRSAVLSTVLTMVLASAAWSAVADEQAELERTLHAFLAAADERAVHESFWADDLIYTSSSGERFGKADILAGFEEPAPEDAPPAPDYSAEEVNLRMLGDLAVVTFRLVAEQDGQRIGEYFNTGVFRSEDGDWQAFTWQATRIPEPSAD